MKENKKQVNYLEEEKITKKIGSANLAEPIESRDIVAGFVGVGRTTLQKAEDIVTAAEEQPEKSQVEKEQCSSIYNSVGL